MKYTWWIQVHLVAVYSLTEATLPTVSFLFLVSWVIAAEHIDQSLYHKASSVSYTTLLTRLDHYGNLCYRDNLFHRRHSYRTLTGTATHRLTASPLLLRFRYWSYNHFLFYSSCVIMFHSFNACLWTCPKRNPKRNWLHDTGATRHSLWQLVSRDTLATCWPTEADWSTTE